MPEKRRDKIIKTAKRNKGLLVLVFGSIIATVSLFLSTTGLSYTLINPEVSHYFLMGSIVSFALSQILIAFTNRKKKFFFFSHLGLATCYMVAGFLSYFILEYDPILFAVTVIFTLTFIANRVINIILDHRIHVVIYNCIVALLGVVYNIVCIALIFADPLAALIVYILLFVLLSVMAVKDIFALVFGKIKGTILKEILIKTYAFEIMIGFVILILAFSLVFTMVEPAMEDYGDALWYSFCIVTTIGLGDLTCTSVVGRVLSVILGIYGIIMVALITSIIVNFYNESSAKRKKEEEEAFKEKEVEEIVEKVLKEEKEEEKENNE